MDDMGVRKDGTKLVMDIYTSLTNSCQCCPRGLKIRFGPWCSAVISSQTWYSPRLSLPLPIPGPPSPSSPSFLHIEIPQSFHYCQTGLKVSHGTASTTPAPNAKGGKGTRCIGSPSVFFPPPGGAPDGRHRARGSPFHCAGGCRGESQPWSPEAQHSRPR